MLVATKRMNAFGHFSPFFEQKNWSKIPFRLFLFIKEFTKKDQVKIPIFSKSDVCATWWPNTYEKILTCGQLRNTQRYQEYCTRSSQQWVLLVLTYLFYSALLINVLFQKFLFQNDSKVNVRQNVQSRAKIYLFILNKYYL